MFFTPRDKNQQKPKKQGRFVRKASAPPLHKHPFERDEQANRTAPSPRSRDADANKRAEERQQRRKPIENILYDHETSKPQQPNAMRDIPSHSQGFVEDRTDEQPKSLADILFGGTHGTTKQQHTKRQSISTPPIFSTVPMDAAEKEAALKRLEQLKPKDPMTSDLLLNRGTILLDDTEEAADASHASSDMPPFARALYSMMMDFTKQAQDGVKTGKSSPQDKASKSSQQSPESAPPKPQTKPTLLTENGQAHKDEDQEQKKNINLFEYSAADLEMKKNPEQYRQAEIEMLRERAYNTPGIAERYRQMTGATHLSDDEAFERIEGAIETVVDKKYDFLRFGEDYIVPYKMLSRYTSASEEDLEFSAGEMRKMPKMEGLLERNRNRFKNETIFGNEAIRNQLKSLEDGQTITLRAPEILGKPNNTQYTDEWAATNSSGQNTTLDYIDATTGANISDAQTDLSLGTFQVKSGAKLTATRNGNTIDIKGTINHHLKDRYDFRTEREKSKNPNFQWFEDLKKAVKDFPVKSFQNLETLGLVKPFWSYGEIKENIQFTIQKDQLVRKDSE